MHRFVFEVAYFVGLARMAWHTDKPSSLLKAAVTSGRPNAGVRVLEVGCGLGTNSEWLATHAFNVTAIDLSKVAVRRAQRHLRRRGLRAKIYQADFLQGLKEDPFDVVFARATLHSFPRGERRSLFAKRLAEQVKPEGLLLLAEMRHVPAIARRNVAPYPVDRADLDELFGSTFEITAVGEEFQRHPVLGKLPFAQWSLRRVGKN